MSGQVKSNTYKPKPTSPGRRHAVLVKRTYLSSDDKALKRKQKRLKHILPYAAGRNNTGRITCRHKGSRSHKRFYRQIDFKRNDKDGIRAKVEALLYDPNRSANIALICYLDGERRYILAPSGLTVGTMIMAGAEAPIQVGNCLPLLNIPVGATLHNVEMRPGKGGQIARSAGSSVQLIAKETEYALVRMKSGEIRKIHINCRATIGVVGNE